MADPDRTCREQRLDIEGANWIWYQVHDRSAPSIDVLVEDGYVASIPPGVTRNEDGQIVADTTCQ